MGPHDYIRDWTEEDGPYEEQGLYQEHEYSAIDELRDEEDRCII